MKKPIAEIMNEIRNESILAPVKLPERKNRSGTIGRATLLSV